MHGRVLGGHSAQLQGGLALGCVSGDGGVALETWAVACASTAANVTHPLQRLP